MLSRWMLKYGWRAAARRWALRRCLIVGCLGFVLVGPAADLAWSRPSLKVKKQQSVYLRQLIRTVDALYLSEVSYPLDMIKLQQLDDYLAKVGPQLPRADAAALLVRRQQLSNHQDLWRFREHVLAVFAVAVNPVITPSYSQGQRLYNHHCAACHGRDGGGDGPLASRIPQFDLSLVSQRFQARGLAHSVYNLLLTGLDSGLMVPYSPHLSHELLWHLAFYTVALAEECSGQPAAAFPSTLWRSSLDHPFMLAQEGRGQPARGSSPRCQDVGQMRPSQP